mgnify:CR=1 FL=1
MHDIKDLDVDGFVLSDFGALEIFMEHGLTDKVIFSVGDFTKEYMDLPKDKIDFF